VIQSVLHLHVCADPAPTEPTAAGADYAIEPLHLVADYASDCAAGDATLSETS
jgi:hypothetical protein